MNSYEFYAFGHPCITATHRTTLEFTRDADVTKRGDCILGASSTFSAKGLNDVVAWDRVLVRMQVGDEEARMEATINPAFSDEREMVFRTSDFLSERTLGTRATIAAKDIPRTMVDSMKGPTTRMRVIIEQKV